MMINILSFNVFQIINSFDFKTDTHSFNAMFINKIQSDLSSDKSQSNNRFSRREIISSLTKLKKHLQSHLINECLAPVGPLNFHNNPYTAPSQVSHPQASSSRVLSFSQLQGISNQLIAHTNNQSIPLPIRKQILQLSSLPSNQILLLTRYDLTCFDLNNNDQVYVKEFENAQRLFVSDNYVYVISGSDLSCFTHGGEEQYVNHLASNVLEVQAFNGDNGEQVLVAMDDMSMKRYKGVNIVFDYAKVVGMVNTICWVDNGAMIGTQEGTIAYYESKKSKWKAKSTHPTFKILNWKQGEKDNALVIRKNGSIELRDHKKGETISKIKIGEPIISLHLSDFRTKGSTQLLCVCKTSTVKAYNLEQQQVKVTQGKQIGQQIEDEIKKVDQLLKEKAQLEYDIQQLEEMLNKQQDPGDASGQSPLNADFRIQAVTKYQKGMTLKITCQNGFISGLSFQQAIMPYRIQRSQSMSYVFQKTNKIAGQLVCQALCHSSFSSKSYEIRSFKINLSKFWHWGYTEQKRSQKQIEGMIKFNLVQRNARYIKWMQECFFFDVDEQTITKMQAMSGLCVSFYNWYDDQELEFNFKSKEGKVEIKCDSIDVLGQIVQDLMEYVGMKELDSTLKFPPKDKQRLKEVLNNIEKLSQTKISINSQMAEAVNNIKFLLVKGQSSIAVGNLNDLRQSYGEIMNQNKNILLQIEKKNLNTTSLADSMKVLGKFINQTSSVRFGKTKEEIIHNCRQAIKKKDFPKIVSIMEQGKSAIVS